MGQLGLRLTLPLFMFQNVAAAELDRLLSMVVDVENLFMCVHKEEDIDTKQVYFYLFKLLRRSILQLTKPQIDGPLGAPPFEKPSIAKGVTNFVLVSIYRTFIENYQIVSNKSLSSIV